MLLLAAWRIPIISELLDIARDDGFVATLPLFAIGLGFLIGIWGHAAKSARATAFAILLVFISSILFLLGSLALDSRELPEWEPPSGENCRPYCTAD